MKIASKVEEIRGLHDRFLKKEIGNKKCQRQIRFILSEPYAEFSGGVTPDEEILLLTSLHEKDIINNTALQRQIQILGYKEDKICSYKTCYYCDSVISIYDNRCPACTKRLKPKTGEERISEAKNIGIACLVYGIIATVVLNHSPETYLLFISFFAFIFSGVLLYIAGINKERVSDGKKRNANWAILICILAMVMCLGSCVAISRYY